MLRRAETQHPVRQDGVRFVSGRAGLTGLEPATSAVTVRHSNQAELQPQKGGGIYKSQEPGARSFSSKPQLLAPSSWLRAHFPLQYAFSMDAIRGLYFLMMSRFF